MSPSKFQRWQLSPNIRFDYIPDTLFPCTNLSGRFHIFWEEDFPRPILYWRLSRPKPDKRLCSKDKSSEKFSELEWPSTPRRSKKIPLPGQLSGVLQLRRCWCEGWRKPDDQSRPLGLPAGLFLYL